MLNPDSRTLFLDALRPPDGFEVDLAIGTTYSLDLTAMLVAPLAFARLEAFQKAPEPGQGAADAVDPFALLRAIRSYAERTTVFCQSGRIAVPRSYQRLYTYLERSIVQVTPPSDVGVFHPKMWALRFTGPEGEVHYRVLCLSRNLTFDACWDTALVLDGVLDQNRTLAISHNHPLGDFFAELPKLAVGPVDQGIKRSVARVADELRRVNFDVPENFDGYFFAPIGFAKYSKMPFAEDRCDKRLVISPFVTDGALAQLPGKGGTLVSRLEELNNLKPETLERFKDVFVLADSAEQVDGLSEQENGDGSRWRPPTSGLHAKLYVLDSGWESWVWSGSANASTAAFRDNIEFLVALTGKKSKVGVDACLDSGFAPLLQRYPGKGRVDPTLTEQEKLEEALRRLRADLARCSWKAEAKSRGESAWDVVLSCDPAFKLPENARLTVWPITLGDKGDRSVPAGESIGPLTFPAASLDTLTSFFTLRLTLAVGKVEATDEFVIRADLVGAPENRLARVLESLLETPAQVLRFLRLLLAQDAFDVLEALRDDEATEGAGRGRRVAGTAEAPLLESMLRALAREPSRLDAVEQVVSDLRKLEKGIDRLPPGFLEAWEPIRAARATLGGKKP